MADFNNPYVPPATAVADVAAGEGVDFQPVKIFGTQGRIGRMRYAACMFGASIVLSVAMQVIMAILGVVVGMSAAVRGGQVFWAVGLMDVAFWVVWAIFMALTLIFYVMIGIQRGHDMNLSGWALLWTLIPFVVLVWMLAPGTPGRNRFGAPPPPNSTGVKVVFWISIGLVGFTILLMVLAMVMLRNFAG